MDLCSSRNYKCYAIIEIILDSSNIERLWRMQLHPDPGLNRVIQSVGVPFTALIDLMVVRKWTNGGPVEERGGNGVPV